MKHKKTIIVGVIVLAISFILIALFNSTYAMFSINDYAKSPETYATGLLHIEAVSKTENISLTNALPITDAEGILTEPYIFTIKNVGNLNYNFDIKLLSTGNGVDSFSSQYIKIQVDDGQVMTLKDVSNGVIKDNVTLNVGESIDISIRIWLSIDTPNTEVGKVFNSKIVTDGQAVYTESNYVITTFGEYISNLYIGDNKKNVTNNGVTYNYGMSTNLMSDRLGGITEDYDAGNIRYYGANPNNYIYFNCDDYTNQNSDTCEIWRIIGVFDGKVKIVREDTLGQYTYDYDYDTADWRRASLNNKLLNKAYYYNDDNVKYYNTTSDGVQKPVTINFATDGIGIKNEKTRKLISSNTWHLCDDSSGIFVDMMYRGENSTIGCSSDLSGAWTGMIGLMYASDYGYSTDLSLCFEALDNYDNDADCKANSWITSSQWLLNPDISDSNSNLYISSNGGVSSQKSIYSKNVFPTLYLSDNVVKLSGDGSSSYPYQIAMYDELYKGNAVDYITSLYLSNKDKIVTNNGITYKYSDSVNLMNDRLGGTTEDYDAGNIRYYGADPNNYVDIGDRDSNGNVILYRIIGVFKDMEVVNDDNTTETQNLIKVIRADSIGAYAWDNKTNGIGTSISANGSNDWTDARLMMMLNPGYDVYSTSNPLLDASGDIIYGYKGSLWWNSEDGRCYASSSNAVTSCYFTSPGLSSSVHNKIEAVVWNLGSNAVNNVYTNTMYNAERGTMVYSGHAKEWIGKIALMYVSDYGYATDFNYCNVMLNSYDTDTCIKNDWLFMSGEHQWTLTSLSAYANYVRPIHSSGRITDYNVFNDIVVRPSFYLDSELNIEFGIGTAENPYVLR